MARRWFSRVPDPTADDDGLGQGLLTDLVWWWRFRQCRRRAVAWTAPDRAPDPAFDRFADWTLCTGLVDGRRWVVRERAWAGWPDPPRFVFFALDPDGRVWAAADFHNWPTTWELEGGNP